MSGLFSTGDSDFETSVLKAKLPVLVDFWAPSCVPCQAVGPIIEELEKEYTGKLAFAKVNVDENPKTTTRYGIRSIPTLLLFKDGKPFQQLVGLRPKKEVKHILDTALT